MQAGAVIPAALITGIRSDLPGHVTAQVTEHVHESPTESAVRDAVAKLDPQFGYADGFDEATGEYRKLIWAQVPPELLSSTAVLVREVEAKRQLSVQAAASPTPGTSPTPPGSGPQQPAAGPKSGPQSSGKPHRFYGSVEIDMVRPVKSFDAILNAVVMELQRTQGAKIKLTLEIQAEANEGFADSEVSVIGTMRASSNSNRSRRASRSDDRASSRNTKRLENYWAINTCVGFRLFPLLQAIFPKVQRFGSRKIP